jgi:hypothetical protein
MHQTLVLSVAQGLASLVLVNIVAYQFAQLLRHAL